MPYPPHVRLVWGGRLFADEQFSCSVKLGRTVGGPALGTFDPDAYIDDWVNDLRRFWTANGIGIGTSAMVEWVKANNIGPDGRYSDQTRTVERNLDAVTRFSGSGSNYLPPQSAVAVTMRANRSRGPLSRGRFFIPFQNPIEQATGRIQPNVASALATAAATLMADLGNHEGLDLNSVAPVLVSNGGRGLPEGGTAKVTRIEVGRAIDTQQRRRNSLPEMAVGVPVP